MPTIRTERRNGIPISSPRTVSVGITAIVFLIPSIAIFAPKAMVLTMVAALLTVVLFSPKRFKISDRVPGYLWLGLGVLICWGAISALWSPIPFVTLRVAAAALITFAAGLYLINALSTGLLPAKENVLFWGIMCAVALLLFEQLSDGTLMRHAKGIVWAPLPDAPEHMANIRRGHHVHLPAFYLNSIVVMSLLAWPAATRLAQDHRWLKLIVLVAGVAWSTFTYGNAASVLALLAGASVTLLAYWRIRLIARFLAIVVAGSILAAPLATSVLLSDRDMEVLANKLPSVGLSLWDVNRLVVWQFVGDRIVERPITGWGLRSSRAIPGGSEKYVIHKHRSNGTKYPTVVDQYLPLHPHNQPLQIWLELGGIGALIVATTIAIAFWQSGGSPVGRHTARWRLGLSTSVLIYASLSFGMWQSWWLATIFLAFALMQAADRIANDLEIEPSPHFIPVDDI